MRSERVRAPGVALVWGRAGGRLRRACAGLALLGLAAAFAACGQVEVPTAAALAGGDATRGAQLFAANCANCHATSREMRLGPGMGGLFSPAGPARPPGVTYGANLPNGQPITDVNVATWVRSGGQGQIAYMPGFNLSDAQLADLIAYLKTL